MNLIRIDDAGEMMRAARLLLKLLIASGAPAFAAGPVPSTHALQAVVSGDEAAAEFAQIFYKGKKCEIELKRGENPNYAAAHPLVIVGCEGGGPRGDEKCEFKWLNALGVDSGPISQTFYGKSVKTKSGEWDVVETKSFSPPAPRDPKDHVSIMDLPKRLQQVVDTECPKDHSSSFETSRHEIKFVIPSPLAGAHCMRTNSAGFGVKELELRCVDISKKIDCKIELEEQSNFMAISTFRERSLVGKTPPAGFNCIGPRCFEHRERRVEGTRDRAQEFAQFEFTAINWMRQNCN